MYDLEAHSDAPAYILFLVDVSRSMSLPLAGRRRIDVVREALDAAATKLVFRSTKGAEIADRYRLRVLTYSDHVYDQMGGFEGIGAFQGMVHELDLEPRNSTDTALAFQTVKAILEHELPFWQDYPAPVVCHVTDGEFTGKDPGPVAQQVRQLAVRDGSVLVANVFIADEMLTETVVDAKLWPGVTRDTELKTKYARTLRDVSSELPPSYHRNMAKEGYRLSERAVMMVPGLSAELVRLAFVMSTATPHGAQPGW